MLALSQLPLKREQTLNKCSKGLGFDGFYMDPPIQYYKIIHTLHRRNVPFFQYIAGLCPQDRPPEFCPKSGLSTFYIVIATSTKFVLHAGNIKLNTQNQEEYLPLYLTFSVCVFSTSRATKTYS
jgi:hypothetical protein